MEDEEEVEEEEEEVEMEDEEVSCRAGEVVGPRESRSSQLSGHLENRRPNPHSDTACAILCIDILKLDSRVL
ncbi:hypothetical protein V1478_014857 [Vespula squamosa]|uniref:Uncharacterized protein n=1 Tax=Vespula squamosa TaxID=30214 RepID=A0ABD2A3G4_VESSQ